MRIARGPMIAAIGAAVLLAALAAVYWYTIEPAPAVKVRWREGLAADQRAALERRFRLVDPILVEGRTVTYNVLDTSRENLRAIVTAGEVEDTNEIDRARFTLRPDVPYGTRWMWLADRLPLLRLPGAVMAVIVACLAALGWSLRAVLRMPGS
jgi:hypothetical protein